MKKSMTEDFEELGKSLQEVKLAIARKIVLDLLILINKIKRMIKKWKKRD